MSEKAPINEPVVEEKVLENFFGLNEQEIIDEQTEPGIHANKAVWIEGNVRALRGVVESTLRGASGEIEVGPEVVEALVSDVEVREKYSESRRALPGEEKAFDFKQFLVDRIAAIKTAKTE